MTTKPKARKYRIRRSAALSEALKNQDADKTKDAPGAARAEAAAPSEDGFGDNTFPTAAPRNADRREVEKAIEAIRAEGLTSRQLRMARRVAQRHGLAPQSDFDAVRMLRDRGIDPFKRGTMLELVVPEDEEDEGKPQNKLPKTVDAPKVPGPAEQYDEAARAKAVMAIQQDIARRRRRQLAALFLRLGAFIAVPTILVGIYFGMIATPLYSTRSEFLIQQADSAGGSGLGGLFSGTGFATSQDSITVQSYLQSREAMLRLEQDIGFRAQFEGDGIDPLLRLAPDATNEQAYRLYKKMVKLGYDPTEGIVKMEVIAPSPAVSEDISRALIAFAEEQVDQLTQRLREDQMQGSRESYEEAEAKMVAAQQKVLELQERLGVIDAASETSALMGQITGFETQAQEKRLQLQQLLDNARPNQARVDGVRGDISRLEAVIAELRSQLTESGTGTASLASISGELRLAQLDLETRTALMQQALQQLESARIEANRQVRYLSLGVSPVAPDEATYPKTFENTAVSLMIFAGIYLMLSLTVSVLREQVSA